MPVINPPKIDREALCREAEARRCMEGKIKQIVALLQPGERLAEPYRADDRIIVPVAQDDRPDVGEVHALVAAWLDEPVVG